MTIQVDSREKPKATKNILSHFDAEGIDYCISKLFAGDYALLHNQTLIIDRKQNLNELCSNVCQNHKRFVDELERAAKHGIKLIILVEHSNRIKSLEDVRTWQNPRIRNSPLAVSGERLYKILTTMTEKYGFEVQFCDKENTGKRIVEILSSLT